MNNPPLRAQPRAPILPPPASGCVAAPSLAAVGPGSGNSMGLCGDYRVYGSFPKLLFPKYGFIWGL